MNAVCNTLTLLIGLFALTPICAQQAVVIVEDDAAQQDDVQPSLMPAAASSVPASLIQAKSSVEPTTRGQVFRDCPECPEMVLLPAGRFSMGSPPGELQRKANEGPIREVNVASFALARTEVTVADFLRFVEATGYQTDAETDRGESRGCAVWAGTEWEWFADASWRSPQIEQTNLDPVVCLSWDDAQQYVKWLSRSTGKYYRLPSESEWEYAARAETSTRFNTGVCITTLQANFAGTAPARGCPAGDYRQRTVPVGSYPGNAFGLHDMHGNVWEWVEDCWNENYLQAPSDGSAWLTGDCGRRVLRGGSWFDFGQFLRSSIRFGGTHTGRNYGAGLRPARSL